MMNKQTRALYDWMMGEPGWVKDLRNQLQITGVELSEGQRDRITEVMKARLSELVQERMASASPAEVAELARRLKQIRETGRIDWLELGTVLIEDELHGNES